MPIHDWTHVDAGIFHAFHQDWIVSICRALNAGVLPADYFAMPEQSFRRAIPDVVALCLDDDSEVSSAPGSSSSAVAPPRTRMTSSAKATPYIRKTDHITVRHSQGRVVAVAEIVSPGNKASRSELQAFVQKSCNLIQQGIHLLVVDLFPPSKRDPQGIHKAIWDEIEEEQFELPPDKPLTLVSYSAGLTNQAYLEPIAIGEMLPDMPLFLEPEFHVPVPLEATYQNTRSFFPAPMRKLLE